MSENIDGGELERSLLLMRVIEKQPKLFSKWVELKERFSILGWADSAAAKEPPVFISDVLKMINEAFDNDEEQPALID